jgi:beta-N-acetylhexosaminidase
MLIMGWDGTEVTPQIRTLIEQHHLGSILLTAKNLKCCLPRPCCRVIR